MNVHECRPFFYVDSYISMNNYFIGWELCFSSLLHTYFTFWMAGSVSIQICELVRSHRISGDSYRSISNHFYSMFWFNTIQNFWFWFSILFRDQTSNIRLGPTSVNWDMHNLAVETVQKFCSCSYKSTAVPTYLILKEHANVGSYNTAIAWKLNLLLNTHG